MATRYSDLTHHRTLWFSLLTAAFFGVSLLIALQLYAGNSQWVITSVMHNQAAAAPSPFKSTIPSCTPSTFTTPDAVPLDNAPEGLTVQNNGIVHYQIYGNTVDDLTNQVQRCAPKTDGGPTADFTAETYYQISWQYNTLQNGNNCSLANVKVGLSTTIVMPLWQPTASIQIGLDSRWQNFTDNLTTHEEGHVAIDNTYAERLTNDLQAPGSVPCNEVATIVAAVTSTDIVELNQANDAYDVTTSHGATQGATLPAY